MCHIFTIHVVLACNALQGAERGVAVKGQAGLKLGNSVPVKMSKSQENQGGPVAGPSLAPQLPFLNQGH